MGCGAIGMRCERCSSSMESRLAVAALCAAWYCASSASNVVGKLVLTEFPWPLTVAVAQLAGTAALSAPALWVAGVRRAAWPRGAWRRALGPLAAAKVLTAVCSQLSLAKVPVSYAHTVKATTPLWTAALARVACGERQAARVQGALAAIAAGVALASATELQWDGAGLAAALAASALLAAQHLLSKRVLADTRVHHLRLLQTLSAAALALAAPLWACADGAALLSGPAPPRGWARTGALLAADGALAWLQAVLAFSVLSRVAPLTYAVASAAKRAVVVAASLLLLRNPAPPLNLAGMALALLGVLAYDRARAHARPSRAARPPLPV